MIPGPRTPWLALANSLSAIWPRSFRGSPRRRQQGYIRLAVLRGFAARAVPRIVTVALEPQARLKVLTIGVAQWKRAGHECKCDEKRFMVIAVAEPAARRGSRQVWPGSGQYPDHLQRPVFRDALGQRSLSGFRRRVRARSTRCRQPRGRQRADGFGGLP